MEPDSKERRAKKSAGKQIAPGPDIRKYVENRIELFSISIAEQIAMTVSTSIQKFIGLLFLSFGVVFLWIALGFFLGEVLNSQALGFFLASLPLLILGFIFYNRSSKNLEQKIQSDIIEKIALNFEQKTASLAEPENDNDKKELN